ncbi:MAG: M15 family metallopeptidase [Candidatus Nanopelagicales bacterium]
MADLQTDISMKNTLMFLDKKIEELSDFSDSIAKNLIATSKNITAKENLQNIMERYYLSSKPIIESPVQPTQRLIETTYEATPAPPQVTGFPKPEKEEESKIEPPIPPVLPGAPSQYPQDGSNGKLTKDQLRAVGTLSSSPEGGPYWYGRTAYLRPDAAQQFIRAQQDAKSEGVTIIINSAYRSIEHQKALQGKYAVVAAPGTSPHGLGIALDIETGAGWNWMVKNGKKYGWKWMAIPDDEVHFEYVGGGQSVTQPVKKQRVVGQQEQASVSGNRQVVALVNQQPIPATNQIASSQVNTSLNTNYSNFSEVLLSHTTFNVG